KLRSLGRDARRTRVQVALAGHVAADGNQAGRAEAELLGSEQGGNDDVPRAAQTTVGPKPNARPQALANEHLLRLGNAHLPGAAGVLDAAQRTGAGSAVEARDQDVVGVRLRDAGGDRAHARLGDQLDADAPARVDPLQVVDELGQVFD